MSGVWLLPSDAAKHLGLPFDNERQFKRDSELDVSRHVERGAQCSSTAPYNRFDYVCVLKDAPAGWQASANACLTLAEFIHMCEHFSDDKNWTSADGVISKHFQMYTGRTCNPRNIRNAFTDGALYSSQSLQENLLEKQANLLENQNVDKRRCEGIRSQRLSEYASLNPDSCT